MTEQEILSSAEQIVARNEFALVGTVSKKYPNIRALRIMKRDGLKTFYFSTKSKSDKVKQMKWHKKGCVYFYDTTTFTFSNVLIEGKFIIEPNTTFGISNFYKMDAEPYDFCTIKFVAKYLYFYAPYKKYKINMNKLENNTVVKK